VPFTVFRSLLRGTRKKFAGASRQNVEHQGEKPQTSHLPFFFVEFFKSLSYFTHNLGARPMQILRPFAQGDFDADAFSLGPGSVT
jgi:hypothetical protein